MTPKPTTHAELVKRAAKWLQKTCAIVVTEMTSQSEEPDAIGFRGGWTILVECKTSRADFKAEKHKTRERMGDARYFLVPAGLVRPEECPDGWGLLYAYPKKIVVILKGEWLEEKDSRSEQRLLISCIRRIGRTAPEGISVKYYTYKTKCRATLGMRD